MAQPLNEKAFNKRLLEILNNGLLSIGLSMGYELKLFDALAAVSSEDKPATSKAVADHLNMRERYVHEWICFMVCGSIIEVDKSGTLFWIKKEQEEELCGEKPSAMLVFQQNVLMSAGVYKNVLSLFQKNGPLGLDNSQFDDFDQLMALFSDAERKGQMKKHFVAALGLQQKLQENELAVLDVGCGIGTNITELAREFQKSSFIGIDISANAIEFANKRKGNVNNLSFIQMNAQKMREDWKENFDWVMVFDAIHDQTLPDLALKEIWKILKPDGIFTMIEINGTSNVYEDKKNAFSTFLYGISLTHCLPVALNVEGGYGLGAMWGQAKAIKLLNDAGFKDVKVQISPFIDDCSHLLYICSK